MELKLADLESAERKLADALETGTVFGSDSDDMSHWPTIRASVIRNLLHGAYRELIPDPKGLRLRHVCVYGRIDLDYLQTRIALEIDTCRLSQGLTAAYAQLTVLKLCGIQIHQFSADDALIYLEGLRVDHLEFTDMSLRNPAGVALYADRLTVYSSATMEGLKAQGNNRDGAVRLPGVTIHGQLQMGRTQLNNIIGPALAADNLTVESGAFFDEGFTANGEVRLMGAVIKGELSMRGAELANHDGPALAADGITVESTAYLAHDPDLHRKFTVNGAGNLGAVRLGGATIKGQLVMHGAKLTNNTGPALSADRVTVESGAFLDEKFTATGAGPDGAFRLVSATIKGQLVMHGARLTNNTGPALSADKLTVESGAFLDEGFTATGHSRAGAVRLMNATFKGQLVMRGAQLTNYRDSALDAEGLTVESNAYLDGGFTATGNGNGGAVEMRGAIIKDSLVLTDANLTNKHGPALNAAVLKVEKDLQIDFVTGIKGDHHSPTQPVKMKKKTNREYHEAAVVLSRATVGAQLDISESTLREAHNSKKWNVIGLTYCSLQTGTNDCWLEFLEKGTHQYSTQPYQQYAAVTRTMGEENRTRKILIAQRDDQLSRSHHEPGLLTFWERTWTRLLKVTVSYGYRTWKALLALLITVALAVIVTFIMSSGAFQALTEPPPVESVDTWRAPCDNHTLWALGLETIPLIPRGTAINDKCVITDTEMGDIYFALSTGLKILAWAQISLFVAGFTNIVRKPGP